MLFPPARGWGGQTALSVLCECGEVERGVLGRQHSGTHKHACSAGNFSHAGKEITGLGFTIFIKTLNLGLGRGRRGLQCCSDGIEERPRDRTSSQGPGDAAAQTVCQT